MPSVAFLGMNRFGERVYRYLTEHEETVALGVFTEKSQYRTIQQLEPDYLVSAGFDYVLPEHVLDVPKKGAINLHPSYLPYNRGVNPDVWSIIAGGPAGVSIHYMTPDIDAGPIIAQQKVDIAPSDSGRDLRERLDNAMVELFKESWEDIYTGNVEEKSQNPEAGTTNRSSQFGDLCKIDLEAETKVGDLIDRLRALTFPPYHNAYFEKDGKRYFVRVSIESEDDIQFDEFEWDTPTLF